MRRYTQTEEDILTKLTRLDSTWQDPHALKIIGYLSALPSKPEEAIKEIEKILDLDFDCGADITRLFLDLSADEFRAARKGEMGAGTGVIRFKQDKSAYMAALVNLGLETSLREVNQSSTALVGCSYRTTKSRQRKCY